MQRLTSETLDEVLDRFAFHPANETTRPMHETTREEFANLVEYVVSELPPGRHKSLALTALQQAQMWCNAAIAIDSGDGAYENYGDTEKG